MRFSGGRYPPSRKEQRRADGSQWEASAIEVSTSIKPVILQEVARDIAQIKKDRPL
jgi:hypothetical protein